LHLIHDGEVLTNAGSLLFVETPVIGIDYIRRDAPGADSSQRIRSRRALLEQVWEADHASQTANRVIHLAGGFAHGQVRALPRRALREAIVNGVVHRDWLSGEPTTIEHVGDVLTVTSPGGFIGGVSPHNIITHPSVARYRSLAEAMASLRLAEREGIGVDRMVRDMLSLGLPEPEISEVEGPYVRVGLLGGEPNRKIVELVAGMEPSAVASDVDAMLIIDHLCRCGWIDPTTAVPVLQRPVGEATVALHRLLGARAKSDQPIVVRVRGIPAGLPDAYRLSQATRLALSTTVPSSARNERILAWARARGRVSSTEVADLFDISTVRAGAVLSGMEAEGMLRAGRANRMGRGFFYMPTD
jgi:ATP-dependent DNA helicase RecG